MPNSETKIYHSDDLDLLQLLKVLNESKKIIFMVSGIIFLISTIFCLFLPNIYRAETVLAPASYDRDVRMSSVLSQFGGIASLAGINVGDDRVDKSDLAIEVLKSRKFVREFVERHKILPLLMAVDSWDTKTRKIEFNKSLYNPKTKSWNGDNAIPSAEEVYEKFRESLIIIEENNTEFVRVGFYHQSPDIAAKWTSLLIKDLNNDIRKQDIQEAEGALDYLNGQVDKSKTADLRDLFYNLIQAQTETMMLANVREEYVFKTIDPATVPENKFKPKRVLITFIATILSVFIMSIIILIRYFTDSKK